MMTNSPTHSATVIMIVQPEICSCMGAIYRLLDQPHQALQCLYWLPSCPTQLRQFDASRNVFVVCRHEEYEIRSRCSLHDPRLTRHSRNLSAAFTTCINGHPLAAANTGI